MSTGETGAARAEAREAIERIVERLKRETPWPVRRRRLSRALHESADRGRAVAVGALGMEGTIVAHSGQQAEIDVRGKRMRAPMRDLRVDRPAARAAARGRPRKVRVNVDLKPREGLLSELNVIGCTVDQAVDRVSKFLDDTLVTDQQRDPHRPRPWHRSTAQGTRRVSEGPSAGREVLRRAASRARAATMVARRSSSCKEQMQA